MVNLARVTPLPDQTEWVEVVGNHIELVAEEVLALENVTRINLHDSNVKYISEKFLQTFLHTKQLKTLILSQNNLTIIPKIIRQMDFLTTIQIGNNSIICNCEMKWMTAWINGFITNSGDRIVQDFPTVICQRGGKIGKPIYLLNQQDFKDLGCIGDETLTTIQVAMLSIFASLLILIVIAIVIIGKRWEEVRWMMYLHLDILDKSDRDEDLTNMEYDALLSYR